MTELPDYVQVGTKWTRMRTGWGIDDEVQGTVTIERILKRDIVFDDGSRWTRRDWHDDEQCFKVATSGSSWSRTFWMLVPADDPRIDAANTVAQERAVRREVDSAIDAFRRDDGITNTRELIESAAAWLTLLETKESAQ